MKSIFRIGLSFRAPLVALAALGTAIIWAGLGGPGAPVALADYPAAPLAAPLPYAGGFPRGLSPAARVDYSSPTLADLTLDGKLDIIVGTSSGHVVAVNGGTGAILWSRSVLSYGFAGCSNQVPISSSPAVGTLRAPGGSSMLGVVVGVGNNPLSSGNGGVIAFNRNGDHLWTHLTGDNHGDGCSDGVVASPTVTDVDKDGDDEVLFGSFDTKFYVLNNDGTNYSGWPDVHGDFRDSHWSSPAVGDIDNDGLNEIIVASDEGRLNAGCNPIPSWGYDYCGGTVYAMRLDGTTLAGFPYFTWQAIQSQPALADLNRDGYLDIIFGTGTYYKADTGAYADTFRLFAINYLGQNLPGWPVFLNGVIDGEPAVGDIDGDGHLEVVMGTSIDYCFDASCNGLKQGVNKGYLFALNHDGSVLWSFQPRDFTNSFGPVRAPMIADYDNDGDQDVIYSVQWEVQAVDGDTHAYELGGYGTSNPTLITGCTLGAAPAIGDIDGDSKQEIVAAGSSNCSTGTVYAWKPTGNPGTPSNPWPMFRRNAAHTGRFAPPAIVGGPTALTVIHPVGDARTYTYVFKVQNTGDEAMTFTTSDTSAKITVAPASTSVGAGQTTNMTVMLSGLNTYGLGTQAVGSITMQATYGGGTHAVGSPRVVNVTAIIAASVSYRYLPIIMK